MMETVTALIQNYPMPAMGAAVGLWAAFGAWILRK